MKIKLALLILLASTAPALAQTQPKTLAELFCSFGCENCPVPDSNYYSYALSNPSYGIVIINYHNGISDGQDEFYKESDINLDVDARDGGSFYNLTGDPSGFIDGDDAQNSWQTWEQATSSYFKTSPLTPLTQSPKAVVENDGLIHIVFSATGGPKNSKVWVALKESNIKYANTFGITGYGNPPDSIWNDIFRAMLPNSSDTVSLSPAEMRSFDVVYDPSQFVYSGKWNTDNMEAVVFVQNVNSNVGASTSFDVQSIGVVSLANPAAVAELSVASSSSIRVAGIPSNSELVVSLPAPGRVSIVISDMLGREIQTVADAMMPQGQTSIEMASGILPAGCYIARMIVDGNEVDHAKLIVE